MPQNLLAFVFATMLVLILALMLQQPRSLSSIQDGVVILCFVLVFWFPHAVAAIASPTIRRSNPIIAGVLGSLATLIIAFAIEVQFQTALALLSSLLPSPIELFTFPMYMAVSVACVYAYSRRLRCGAGQSG